MLLKSHTVVQRTWNLIISSHSKKNIQISKNKSNKYKSSKEKTSNCRSKTECPLEGNCNFKGAAVYKETVTTDKDETETCIGSSRKCRKHQVTITYTNLISEMKK